LTRSAPAPPIPRAHRSFVSSTATRPNGFRPDIEGLRAIAILTVLAFHASVPHLAGGFIGVDIFFVISGFLITGLLLEEILRTGRISLPQFYARRARRILPSAGVVLVLVALGSWIVNPPLRRVDVAHDILAAAVYLSNWRAIATETDYMAAGLNASPLLHYWSLAVEEQFYLVWPPLLFAMAALGRRLRLSALVLATAVLIATIVGSFMLGVHWTHVEEPMAYMGSPSRAWQFGIGAGLAFAVPAARWLKASILTRALRLLLGWGGIAAVGWATIMFDATTPFPGTAALVPTLGTAMIIAAGTSAGPGEATTTRLAVGPVLATRLMRAIGRLSFAWYLWHWPLLVLIEGRTGELSWPAKLGIVAFAAVPSAITMRLVERPFRFSRVVLARPSRGLAIGATAMLLPVSAGLAVGSSSIHEMGGIPGQAGAILPQISLATNTVDPFAHLGRMTRGPVTPSPQEARDDLPHYPKECIVSAKATTSPRCIVNAAGSHGRVVLLGDSHAGQWFGAVEGFARQHRWAVEVLNKTGCPLPRIAIVNPQLGRAYTECDRWRDNTLRRLAVEPRPQLIFVATLILQPEIVIFVAAERLLPIVTGVSAG
jgi:peptidoglycan/LPS O-acetylase OafA/YrhL